MPIQNKEINDFIMHQNLIHRQNQIIKNNLLFNLMNDPFVSQQNLINNHLINSFNKNIYPIENYIYKNLLKYYNQHNQMNDNNNNIN